MLLKLVKIYAMIDAVDEFDDPFRTYRITIDPEEIKAWYTCQAEKNPVKASLLKIEDFLKDKYSYYYEEDALEQYGLIEGHMTHVRYLYDVTDQKSQFTKLWLNGSDEAVWLYFRRGDSGLDKATASSVIHLDKRCDVIKNINTLPLEVERIIKFPDRFTKTRYISTYVSVLEWFEKTYVEVAHFAEAHMDGDYDGMKNAMAWAIAAEADKRNESLCFYGREDLKFIFDELYYTNGTDIEDWDSFADYNGIDPDDDAAREKYEDGCDEFAMARYKLDYSCRDEIIALAEEILNRLLGTYY